MARFTPNVPFFYQVGDVKTYTPWQRPKYNTLIKFFKDPAILKVIERYTDVLLSGGALYEKLTWDLDLLLIYDWNENTDWNQVEEDINVFNDIALNEYGLLLDVSIVNANFYNISPVYSKQNLIEYNKDKNLEDWTYPVTTEDSAILIKILHIKKIINGKVELNNFEKNLLLTEYHGKVTKLTDSHLYMTDRRGMSHHPKMIDIVMSFKDLSQALPTLSYSKLLSMTSKEFHDSLVHLSNDGD
jgi:hypothetical protein|tara:strand:- start:755 stop:1483 length:729 start_codon:yes stop_codon:yes gene_type:complete